VAPLGSEVDTVEQFDIVGLSARCIGTGRTPSCVGVAQCIGQDAPGESLDRERARLGSLDARRK